jgi:hypothetical protein
MGWMAFHFANRLAEDRWYSDIHWYRLGQIGRFRIYPFRYPLRLACLAIAYLFAVPLFILFQVENYLVRKEEKEREKRQIEASKQAQERRRQTEETNQRRTLQRRDWFGSNKPTLYFNTVSGVTAVLRPADHERAKRDTQNARTNELWDHAVLKPARETFTFVTKSGGELIQTNCNYARRYKVAGWLSDLYELCQATDCSLVRDETIFVPWVNETLVSFQEQGQILRDCHGQASSLELIDKQAPGEMQPLAVY